MPPTTLVRHVARDAAPPRARATARWCGRRPRFAAASGPSSSAASRSRAPRSAPRRARRSASHDARPARRRPSVHRRFSLALAVVRDDRVGRVEDASASSGSSARASRSRRRGSRARSRGCCGCRRRASGRSTGRRRRRRRCCRAPARAALARGGTARGSCPGTRRRRLVTVPARAGRRVPGHQPRAVPAGARARRRRTATSCVVGDDDQSIYSLARRRRRATSSTSSATSRTRRSSGSSRTTARRRRSSTPPTRWSRTTATASEALWTERGDGRAARARRRPRTSTTRRGVVVDGSSALLDAAATRRPRSRSSTAPTRSRACSRTSLRSRRALRGRRRAALLRARRDQGPLAYLRLLREPRRRRQRWRGSSTRRARGIGDRPRRAARAAAPTARGMSLFEALGRADGLPGLPPRSVRVARGLVRPLAELRRAPRAPLDRVAGAVLDRTRLPRRPRGGGDHRGPGRGREPARSWCGVARSTTRRGRRTGLAGFLEEVALRPTPTAGATRARSR